MRLDNAADVLVIESLSDTPPVLCLTRRSLEAAATVLCSRPMTRGLQLPLAGLDGEVELMNRAQVGLIHDLTSQLDHVTGTVTLTDPSGGRCGDTPTKPGFKQLFCEYSLDSSIHVLVAGWFGLVADEVLLQSDFRSAVTALIAVGICLRRDDEHGDDAGRQRRNNNQSANTPYLNDGCKLGL